MLDQGQKLKSVEHYNLQQLITSSPLAQFWSATHKILKKEFVLKKVRGGKQGGQEDPENPSSSCALAKLEASLLAEHKGPGAPRCQKLIRTVSNTYLVLGVFPGEPLADWLSCLRSPAQLLGMMLAVSRQLKRFHQRNLSLLLLSLSSLYLDCDGNVLFSDWSLARTTGSEIEPSLLLGFANIPASTLKNCAADPAADLFALSLLFQPVLSRLAGHLKPQLLNCLQQCLLKMGAQDPVLRPQIGVLVGLLKRGMAEHRQLEPDTPTFQPETRRSSRQLRRALSSNQLLAAKREELRQAANKKKRKGSAAELQLALSRSHLQGRTEGEARSQEIADRVLASRQFVSFLLSLSIFFQEWSPRLCVMLLKQAQSAIRSASQQSESLKSVNLLLCTRLGILLRSQARKVLSLLLRAQNNASSLGVSNQLADPKTEVDPKQFKAAVKDVANRMAEGNAGGDINRAELLFQLYLLARSLEFQETQDFWQEVQREQHENWESWASQERQRGDSYLRRRVSVALDRN